MILATALLTLLVPNASATYTQGFESGVNPSDWTLTGLWKVTACQANSGTYSLGYVNEPACDFNVGDTAGDATMPAILLDGNGLLIFDSYMVTENACGVYDRARVYVSNDGGLNWAQVFEECDNAGFTQQVVDLSAYLGQTVLIRFNFNSGDDLFNEYPGWYVDNVIVGGSASPPVPELGTAVLMGVGLVGVGAVVLARRE